MRNAPTQTPKNTKAKALTGPGSLELSRGSSHVIHDGVALTGERDIFTRPLDTAALATVESAG